MLLGIRATVRPDPGEVGYGVQWPLRVRLRSGSLHGELPAPQLSVGGDAAGECAVVLFQY